MRVVVSIPRCVRQVRVALIWIIDCKFTSCRFSGDNARISVMGFDYAQPLQPRVQNKR